MSEKALKEAERLRGMLEFDNLYRKNGSPLLAGIDEAGRGPLAGSVFAAAVILPENVIIDGLNDSKKLSPQKREELFDIICDKALAYAVAETDEKRIDEINILNADFEAMNKAVSLLSVSPDFIIVDGNAIKNMEIPHETVVKGDSKSMSIAAASILAKVSRDRCMVKAAELYPEYGFEKHKGYGTKAHYEALAKYGPCPIHRMSFLKNLSDHIN